MATATLEVRHDGIRAHATVSLRNSAATLDDVLTAALQSDREMSNDYADVLRVFAPQLYLHIEKEIDGSRDNGCCWLAVYLTYAPESGVLNGDSVTRLHRFTRTEFRGWNPTDEQVQQEMAHILRRAAGIGLGYAQYWRGDKRTVAENL